MQISQSRDNTAPSLGLAPAFYATRGTYRNEFCAQSEISMKQSGGYRAVHEVLRVSQVRRLKTFAHYLHMLHRPYPPQRFRNGCVHYDDTRQFCDLFHPQDTSRVVLLHNSPNQSE